MSTVLEIFEPGQMQLVPASTPWLCKVTAGKMGPNLTVQAGTILGLQTSTGYLLPYSSANTDGTQNPCAIAGYSFVTDNGQYNSQGVPFAYFVLGSGTSGSGLAAAAAPSYRTPPQSTIPIYTGGTFWPKDLIGFDANAQTKMLGKTNPNGSVSITC